jgi:Mn-dependent DtxR family transcriptional regulator
VIKGIAMPLNESGEMYLETILVLSQTEPIVHAIDVANYLGYSKPAVSRAVALLKKRDYVSVEGDGALVLTAKGKKQAAAVYERHTTIAEFLRNLGIQKDTADKDACRIEHIISTETFEKIKEQLAR